jgi:maltoporin
MAGGYLRRFAAAGPDPTRDEGWEYIADVRPHAQIAGDVEGAVDLSYQARFPRALSPTELEAMDPAVFQIAPMVLYSPFGRGSYDRPQMRVVYRAAHLNAAARDLYAMEDPRRDRAWVHYLGLQAEWWFNSTYR